MARLLAFLILFCVGCDKPTHDNAIQLLEGKVGSSVELLEGVVDSVIQVEDRQIQLTLDGETDQYECGLPADKFYIGEYHTFIVIDNKIETVYFGESSGDLNELEMMYDD